MQNFLFVKQRIFFKLRKSKPSGISISGDYIFIIWDVKEKPQVGKALTRSKTNERMLFQISKAESIKHNCFGKAKLPS